MKRLIGLTLSLLALLGTLAPLSAFAQEPEQKVVRVGWYESTFCYRDAFGRRCGIDYEYQHKISAYTGWTYEYVEDSWSNLLQMLIDGEIDLLSDVSYTPERTALMSFPDLPMGAESYYVYIDADNRDITAEQLSSFNGKRIGVNRGSVQEGYLRDWAERNRLRLEVVPLAVEEAESMDMLAKGEIDGYVSTNTFGAKERVVPVCRVGASDFYYAVNRNRPDLLEELNGALSAIQEEDPYFNERMSEEHLFTTQTNAFLTPNQEDYLAQHGSIRVGYLAGELPFCDTDPETGELTGALRDYLAHAANSLKTAGLHFEALPYPTTEAALEAMRAGEVDCVFPVNLSSYEADELGIRLTNAAMKTEMQAVLRRADTMGISPERALLFAVSEGHTSVETFIKDHYPLSRMETCADTRAGLEAVADGEADCVLVSSYQIHDMDMEDLLEKRQLDFAPTGESMPLAFAVSRANRELYFILNKTVVLTRSQDMDSALASYARSDQRISVAMFLRENWVGMLLSLTAVFAVIVVLLLQKLKAERRANEQQRLLEEAAEIAELKQTITSLLDNMPGMTFTKDGNTGTYLACNRAFAAFAHQKDPEGVIGRTDAELFDAETAAKYVQDDRMALSMDQPYIFFEDMPDAAGNARQMKTTKLKYTDAAGRLCVLGISQDVTDTFRIHREHATSKEAYEKARGTGIIFTYIAQALARGYSNVYYVNLDTEGFIEYRTDEESGNLTETRRGWHFFEECQLEVERLVYPDDQESVKQALERKTLVAALERSNTFILTYRRVGENSPTYVTMKVTRMKEDERTIILGVTDVDELMKHRRAAERMQEEQIASARLKALAGDFLCIYVVVPETGRYREFSESSSFTSFERPREGMDFFADSRAMARETLYPGDVDRFCDAITRENVIGEIQRHGFFTLSYQLMLNSLPTHVQLRAAMVEEKEGPRLVVGIYNIDVQVRQEAAYARRLEQVQTEAHIDTLTGVKNRHAFLVAEERLNVQIKSGRAAPFAIVFLDVNDLKKVNDTQGHSAGDQLLRSACKIICDTFQHSPVFRVGGDEFAVISQGSDYERRSELAAQMYRHNLEAIESGGVVIACGMAEYAGDESVAAVFERADLQMYQNKSELKDRKSAAGRL